MDRPVPVFIAEGQTLSSQHKELLGRFLDVDEWELSKIPPGGLRMKQVDTLINDSLLPPAVVFASCDPVLLAKFCRRSHQSVYLFCRSDDGSLQFCDV